MKNDHDNQRNLSLAAKKRRQAESGGEAYSYPFLVYKEFIAIIISMVVLTIWSIAIDAPLKTIADPSMVENPAKAPWYFVGLQELLVYFDPWLAGVILPFAIIIGLMSIPYVNRDKVPSGVYRIKRRRFAFYNFMLGYAMWFILIIVGQILRGPHWQFYWPWESWDIEKSAEAALVNFSAFWGISALLLYFGLGYALPMIFRSDVIKEKGLPRYIVEQFFLLFMYGVIIKIILRLFFNVHYVLVTPWFNI